MDRRKFRIGLLFSTTGPYATIGRAMRNGAELAVEEVNADPSFSFSIEVIEADPGGRDAEYAAAAKRMLAQDGLGHIVGCYTSSSRKEVLPLFEKHDALLWYPSHYEGFESNEHVVYTGAAPNQHIVPLAEHMLARHGRRAYCVGSNYIWAWENNKIMREAVLSVGGSVLAERYFAVGDTEFDAVIEQILRLRPSFVFNTLIGMSAYAFFRAFRQAAHAHGVDQPAELPIASCSLSEPELIEIGPDACDGHVSSSVYFASIARARNRAFVEAYRRSYPQAGPTSADAESSYLAVHLLARAVQAAGSCELAAVRDVLPSISMDAPQGCVSIDPSNRHCYLTPRIGLSNKAAGFDLLFEADQPLKPDPYLVHHDVEAWKMAGSRDLRVVK
jgi:ABC-type branched-subunit amino acid transport system substrate-binding protein